MLHLATLLIMALQGIPMLIVLDAVFRCRYSRRGVYLAFMITVLVETEINIALGIHLGVKFMLVMAIRILSILVLFEGRTIAKLTVFAGWSLTEIGVEIVLFLFCYAVGQDLPSLSEEFSAMRLQIILMGACMLMLIGCAFVFFWKKKSNKLEDVSLFSVFLPASQMMLIWACSVGMIANNFTMQLMVTCIAGACTFLADAFILRHMYYTREQQRQQEFIHCTNEVSNAKAKLYTEIQEKWIQMEKLRHDYSDQLTTISVLAKEGKTEEITRMVNCLLKTQEEIRVCHFTVNAVADAVISNIAQKCKENRIAFKTQVNLPAEISIPEVHLCSVLSNLLDNAFAATSLLAPENRFIKLETTCCKGYLVVRCTNSYHKLLRPQGGSGYGTQILGDIAERYKGEYTVEKSEGVYIASMLLCMAPTQKKVLETYSTAEV